jgi:hypothetical protein
VVLNSGSYACEMGALPGANAVDRNPSAYTSHHKHTSPHLAYWLKWGSFAIFLSGLSSNGDPPDQCLQIPGIACMRTWRF